MRIKVVQYNGKELFFDVLSFEFRSNQISNWIKVKTESGAEFTVHDVCVVKTD